MNNEKKSPKEAAAALVKEGKSVVTYIIKQNYFDEIIAGRKKKEYRELKATTIKKLVKLDKNGEMLLDENENAIPIHYDAMLLFVGYGKVRDSALVEITGEKEEMFHDEKGNEIFETLEDGSRFYPSQIAYDLGRVLCKEVHPKK